MSGIFSRLRAWLPGGRDVPEPAPGCRADADLSCQDALASVYEYLDGELEGRTPAEIEEHFRLCAECYPHLSCEKAFREALRRAGQGERCPEAVRLRILEALEREP